MLTEKIKEHDQACNEMKQKTKIGHWTNEPNRVEFSHKGFDCLMVRNQFSLHWCGYMAVPKDHPWYERNYNDISVEVHGGLTYSNKCHDVVCHMPKVDGEDDVMWFGFDCAHSHDLSPTGSDPVAAKYKIYRDITYVKNEIENLVQQAFDVRN